MSRPNAMRTVDGALRQGGGANPASPGVRKQDKGGPFLCSQPDSLANSWPISIRVGQSGPRRSTPLPALNGHAVRPRAGRATAAEMERVLARVFRNGTPPRPTGCTREAACAADQRAVRVQFHRRERRKDPRTTDAWRTNAAHEIHGATGSAGSHRRQPARHPSPRVLAEGSSAATRILRRIPEDAQRLRRIRPSFILLSRSGSFDNRPHLTDFAAIASGGVPSLAGSTSAPAPCNGRAPRRNRRVSLNEPCTRRVQRGARSASWATACTPTDVVAGS